MLMTRPFMHLHTLAEVEEKIRPDIDAVSMWAKENKMKMHPAKTKYSIISTRQKIANSAKQSLDLSVDGMQLTKVESERVLGVYIDSHLTWNEHIDTLRQKLLLKIATLARARKYIPTKYRLLFTIQVSNRALLIAELFGATVAKPT